MALFDRKAERDEDLVAGSDAATRALSVTAVENDFVEARLRQARQGLRPHLRPDAASRPPAGDPADGHPGRRPGARGRRRHRHQPVALSARLHGHRHRLLRVDARKGARARRPQGRAATSGCSQMDAADLKFADDSFDIVYAPYLISVVPDPVKVAQRDAPRLPAGRPHHLPQPLPQPEPAPVAASSG